MQKSFYLFFVFSLALFVVWKPCADANVRLKEYKDKNVVEMQEITVTATRAEKEPFKTPNAISVLNVKQIERSNVEHASNLLRDVVGVIAQETTVGQGSPMLRS